MFGTWSVLSVRVTLFECTDVHADAVTNQAAINGALPAANWPGDRRLYPGYTIVAARLELPRIIALEDRTLSIGELSHVQFGSQAQPLVTGALSQELQIPLGALKGMMQKLASSPGIKGMDLAESFRTAVIDYKFLENRWNQYHPTGTGLEVKKTWLKALDEGDLDHAWELFNSLPRPRPPQTLRVDTR